MNLLIHVAGWTLLHFVWQGAIAAVAAAAALRIIPRAMPRPRYAVASVALAAMLASPLLTAGVLLSSASGLWSNDAAAVVVSADPATNSGVPAAAAGRGPIDGGVYTGRWPNTTLLAMVVGAWLCGVLLCFVRIVGGWWRVTQLHRASLLMEASCWQMMAERLAVRLGLRRSIQVVDSELVDTPTLIGWMRPVILLPIAALANLTATQVEAILAHELAHVRRHDYVINLLQIAAETLLFYHPGIWWVSGQIRAEREHCCDDVAIAMCGNAIEYAAALEELETSRTRDAGLAIAATGGPLVVRVRRVLRVPSDDQRPFGSLGVMTALVLLLILVSGALQHLPASRLSDAAAARHVRQPAPPPPPPADAGPIDWQLAETPSFEISYPPALESQVERVGREAEAAYAQLKLDLRHELAFKPRLVLFTTRREMERALATGSIPGNVEHILLPLDTSPARFRGDLVHEVSHVFGLDIIPTSGRARPAWIHEGLAEFERGEWDSSDAAVLREMVRAGNVPRMSSVGAEGFSGNPRLNQILGHAVFDFIVSKTGKNGLRRFLLAVRQSTGGDLTIVYTTTFAVTPGDFDREFEEYLRAHFGGEP
jgi:beta-lactamase regulating signal transducer with metallopeptidase domain